PPMLAALPRHSKRERTQASSVREGRLLTPFSHPSPDRIAAQALPRSCLHRPPVDGLAPASRRRGSSGLRGFSPHVLTRDGHTRARLRPPPPPPPPPGPPAEAVPRPPPP